MRRVIVTGSRDWPDPGTVRNVLRLQLALSPDGLTIVHGHCPTGADKFADTWCGDNGVTVERHPADWGAHGKAAGPLRNQEMIDTGADQVLAFLHEPDGTPSRGTRDCIKRAQEAGIPVDVIFQSSSQVSVYCCDCDCNDQCPGNPDPDYLDHCCWNHHGHIGFHQCQCGNAWPQTPTLERTP